MLSLQSEIAAIDSKEGVDIKTRARKNFICLLLIAAFVAFLPISANAYQVNLTSFQSGYGSTGEIYGYLYGDTAKTTFFHCMQQAAQVLVPGTDYANDLNLTDDSQLRAAWLMDNYAYSLKGVLTNYNPLQTGVAVQSAMWHELTGNWYGDATIQALANTLISKIPNTDLTYLKAKYVYVDLYTANGDAVQDLIRAVPIPAVVWLLGSGLVGLVVIRCRMKK